jgi:O-acetylhomoserine (thiol)-lyase
MTYKDETLAIHAGYSSEATTKAVAVPIYQTTSYAFDNTQHGADLFDLKVQGNIYTRIMNPTTGARTTFGCTRRRHWCVSLSSGMAAITYAIQTITEAGDNIASVSTLYGGTYNLFAHTLPKQGIEVRFFDYQDPEALRGLIDEKTKLVFVESIGNPLGNIIDLEAIAKIAHEYGVPVVVDNTVATPVLLKTL